jgi:16S rRNA processing protein RimM
VSTIPDGLYAVGTIVKAIGVAGEVVVQPMTDFPARFRKLRLLWLGRDSGSVSEARVEKAAVSPRGIRLKLKGVDDRNAAERMRGNLLFVDEAHRAKLPEGQYFVHDVLGLAVREEGGADLGTVADVLRYPASDVYVVRGDRGEILIPAVKEFVQSVDLGSRTMTVRLIEGMTG